VGAGASGALVAGLDPLFDPRSAPTDAVAQGNAGARAVLGPATLAYDVLFPGRTFETSTCDGTGVRRLGAAHVQQQVATFVWTSPCKCFRLMAQVSLNDCGAVTPKATIEFPGFGSPGRASP
jgi:LPS-assembly protein